MRVRESDVAIAVSDWMCGLGLQVVSEYPLLGKVADFCARDLLRGQLIAVECKERDWGRAVTQALRYQAATNLVYVAVPTKTVTANLSDRCSQYGLGLLAIGLDNEVEILVEPSIDLHTVDKLRARTWARFDQALIQDA